MSKKNNKRQIPPPPDADSPWEEQAAYFKKYGSDELAKAGYLRPLTQEDERFVEEIRKEAARRIATRKARGQLNLALTPEQLNRFTQYAKKKHIPPSTLAKAWILERLDQEAKDVS